MASVSGSWIENVVPWPRTLWMSMRPRSASTFRFTTSMPTPRPDSSVTLAAVVDGILLGVGADRFVIPTFAVQESFRPLPEQVQTLHGQACMVQVRDRLYPLLHLGEVFGIAGARQRISEGTVVICHDNGRCVALAVDELIGKQEVVIKGLGEMFKDVRGIAGGAILGDGRIGLILDSGGLLALVGKTTSQVAA